MKEYKFPIKVTITEEDRQKAESYDSIWDCLIATACKRTLNCEDLTVGNLTIHFYGNDGRIVQKRFSDDLNPEWAKETNKESAPFYNKSVVGKSFQIL